MYFPTTLFGETSFIPRVTISFFNLIFILKNGFLGAKENLGLRSMKFLIFQILSKAFEISFLLPEIVPFTPSLAKRIVPLISVVDKIEFNKV